MHYRQTIRDALKDVLIDAHTQAGANVFTSRARPILEILQKREAVLSIYTGDETSQRSGDSKLLIRTLTVTIEGAAGGGDDLDDLLDDLSAEVEAAIDADPMLEDRLHRELVLTSTTSEISARGSQQVGAFQLIYECQYLSTIISDGEPGFLPDTVYVRPIPDASGTNELFDAAQPDPCQDGVCTPSFYGGDLTDENLVIPIVDPGP
jgi:hypothetical protein